MLNDLEEVQKFIQWCKDNKIKSFKHGDLSFELSEIAFIPEMNYDEQSPDIPELPTDLDYTDVRDAGKLEEEQQILDDEDLLFHSSNG